MTFKETGLNAELLRAIEEMGFETPTPIQAKAIPHLLTTNRDMIAFAQTGTGKTAAFGLPAINQTDIDNRETQTIILCPTRELCLQIARDLGTYAKYIKKLNIVPVYGGSSIETQIRALKKGAQIVVGTPGRTKDLIKRKRLILGNVERIILDEADEMLTMGFKEELDTILAEIPEERQTLLFSATMSPKMKSITKKYMEDPLQVSVAKVNVGAKNVEHHSYTVHARDRYELLKRIADMNPNIYGIVFCRTRRETNEVANKLMADGYNADTLNGDLSQSQRDEVMGKFRRRSIQILVATDVAARGLDVDELTHVINYNLPDDDEVYVHRSGRTGRAGKSGISIVISHTRERNKIRDIERKSGMKFIPQTPPTGKEICKTQLYTLIDKIVKVEVNEQQIEPFLPGIYEKLESLSREDLIKHFVSTEFNRFLSYYKNARDLNVADRGGRDRNDRRDRDRDGRRGRDRDDRRGRDRDDRKPSRERKSRSEKRRSTNFKRLFVNVGSKNKLTPARLIGVINEALDSGDAEIGKIEILKKFSFFEIDEKIEPKLTKALNDMEFEGTSLAAEIAESNSSEDSFTQKKKRRRTPKEDSRKWDKGRQGKKKKGKKKD